MNPLSRLAGLALALSLLLSCGGSDTTPEQEAVAYFHSRVLAAEDCDEVITYGVGPGTYRDPTDPPAEEPRPDFYVESLKTTDGRYAFLQTETIRVHAIIGNKGDADWDNGTRDDMYVMLLLSEGAHEDAHSDWKNVGMQQIQKSNIDVGDKKDEYFDINLRTLNHGLALAPGKYNFVVCADRKEEQDNGDGEVLEKHKSNNCSTELVFDVLPDPNYVAPQPNFTISGFTLLQTPTYAGDFIRLGGYVKNSGAFRSPTGIRTSYTISCNGGPTILLTDDGTDADELDPSEAKWEEIQTAVQLPNTPGTCTVTMTADHLGEVSESNEGDNSQSLTLTLLPRPQPDLIITYVGIGDSNDTSIKKGSEKKPTARVRNVGQGPANTRFVTTFYWCDSSHRCSHIATEDTDGLCVGCEVRERKSDWSASKKGQFYLRSCTDANGQEPELDEGNNCRDSSWITVK